MKVQKKNEFEWVEEVHVVNIHKEEASLGKIGLYFYECVLVNIMACVTLLTETQDCCDFFSFLKTRIGSFFGCTSQQKFFFSKVLRFFKNSQISKFVCVKNKIRICL